MAIKLIYDPDQHGVPLIFHGFLSQGVFKKCNYLVAQWCYKISFCCPEAFTVMGCTVIYQSSNACVVCNRFFSICTKLLSTAHLNKHDAKTITNDANRIQNVFFMVAC